MSGGSWLHTWRALPKALLAGALVLLGVTGLGCGAREPDSAPHQGALPGEGPSEPLPDRVDGPEWPGQQTPDRPPPAAPQGRSLAQTPPSPLPRPAPAPVAETTSEESPLTRETLGAIVEGMTVEEVTAMVGRPGVTIASREDSVVLYRWSTEEQSFLAKFEDGKLTRKTSLTAAPEKSPESTLTEDAYNLVQPGMSFEEVLSLLELPGHPVAHQGEELVIYRWSDHQGSSFTARFENHRLVRKTAFVVAPLVEREGEGLEAGEQPETETTEGEFEGLFEGEHDLVEVQIAEAPESREQERQLQRPRQALPQDNRPQASDEGPRQVQVIGSSRRERALAADESPYADRSYRPRPKLPGYTWSLSKGAYEIRVKNPTDGAVEVGIRSGDRGRDITVRPNGESSIFVNQGDYQIHYRYKDKPYTLYRGGLIRIDGAYTADVEVSLIEENYSVRHLQDDGGYRRRP